MQAQQDTGDPRTRRRRLAEAAYTAAIEALGRARAAMGYKAPDFKRTLDELRQGFSAHAILSVHAGELRSEFVRKGLEAMADQVLDDLEDLWAQMMERVV